MDATTTTTTDHEMNATAALIGKLRAERDAAVARAERAEATNRILISELADRQSSAAPQIEVCTLVQDLDNGYADHVRPSDEELAARLNDRWRIQDISIASHTVDARQFFTRVITLTRTVPQPIALPAGNSRFIRVVTALPTIQVIEREEHPLSPTAQALFEQMRADSDARIEAAAPLSPTSKALLGIVS